MKDGTVVITHPQEIDVVRMMTLQRMLKLELMGMHRRGGRSAYVIIKSEFGLKGSKQKVYDAFVLIVENAKRGGDA